MTTIWVEKIKQTDNDWEWVPEAIELNPESDFSIDESELNRELCRMGQILLRYGDVAAELRTELERKEEALKHLFSNLSEATRASAEKTGTKLTVDRVKDLVVTNTLYQDALKNVHILRANTQKADHWWRTANSKTKLLEALAFKQNAELRRAY